MAQIEIYPANYSVNPVNTRNNNMDMFSPTKPVKNQRGQSLIMVVIASGIMGILMMAFASMMTIQTRETKALSDKLAALDLEKTLIASLADGSVCEYITNNPAILTFDSTAVSPTTPQVLTPALPIYSSVKMPGPILGPVVAQINQPASVYSPSLTVQSITLSISGAPSPSPPPGPGAIYTGTWLIGFDSAKLVRGLKPIAIATTLTVDTTNATAAKLMGCQSASGPPNGMVSMWGSGNRCKDDLIELICGNNPGADWNYNVCYSNGHLTSFNEELRWSSAGQGYAMVFTSCPPNTICPAWGANPYKTDVYCRNGFQ